MIRRLRVVGVGNPGRGDDGAGPAVARRLRELSPGLDVVEQRGEALALLETFDGADVVVLVDALEPAGQPGRIHRLDGAAALALAPRASTHGLGVAEAIELARVLGRLPEDLRVYAIEAESFEPGTDLSPAVAAAAECLARQLSARG